MITYNHEDYIREAIEGVMIQNTNFSLELIIADDTSPDHTEEIVASFSNHPKYSYIKYFKHDVNKGMMNNFIWALQQAKGQYVALCEGDDYWTDPNKLQKQVDFLESNPEYSMCFHQGTSIYQNSKKEENSISDKMILNGIVTNNEIIRLGGSLCPTNSIVYRNLHTEFPPFFYEVKSGDRALALLLMLEGKFKFLNENLSVYRIHDGGISRNLDTSQLIGFKDSNITLLEKFNEYSNFKFNKNIKNEISSQVRNIFIYNPKYVLKLDYLKKIKIKHLFLAFARIFINLFKYFPLILKHQEKKKLTPNV